MNYKTDQRYLYRGHHNKELVTLLELNQMNYLKSQRKYFPVKLGNGLVKPEYNQENNFEVLKLLENRVEVLKIMKNKLESMKILKNKLESLKLQENQSVDGLMSADVARGHGGDGGGDDRPLPYKVATGCGGCLGNQGKGTRKTNLGGRRAGMLYTCQETRNLRLKAITDKRGPVPIRFEVDDRETLMPLGDHAAHWANYLGELVRELPLHYPSWRQMPPDQKARVVAKIG
nr:hypothetical protein [Tanacetum cinerariifolium]